MDANGSPIKGPQAIHIFATIGDVLALVRFFVSPTLSVQCIHGTEVVVDHIKAILPTHERIIWQGDDAKSPLPKLGIQDMGDMVFEWTEGPAMVRA